jgi:hypothetical protein
MQRTIDAIPPADIVTVFTAHPGPGRTDQLWNTFGAATISRLADGAKTLAMLWNAAWREGGGETIDAAAIRPLSKLALQRLYASHDFAPSVWLKDWDTLPRH